MRRQVEEKAQEGAIAVCVEREGASQEFNNNIIKTIIINTPSRRMQGAVLAQKKKRKEKGSRIEGVCVCEYDVHSTQNRALLFYLLQPKNTRRRVLCHAAGGPNRAVEAARMSRPASLDRVKSTFHFVPAQLFPQPK